MNITSGPLYNMVHYNTVLDITLIAVGPQLDYFGSMSIHFTLVITRFGYLTRKLALTPAIIYILL